MERRNMSRNHEGARTSERRGREATGASTLARSRVTRASSSTSTNSTRSAPPSPNKGAATRTTRGPEDEHKKPTPDEPHQA